MIRLHSLKFPLSYTSDDLYPAVCRKLQIPKENICSVTLSRKSIDARKKHEIFYILSLDVTLSSPDLEERILTRFRENEVSAVFPWTPPVFPDLSHIDNRPVVIGFGPAGIFAALWLAESGLRPLILERGRNAEQRTRDVNDYFTHGASAFSPLSNVQFGEGGAGTFSDGKLNSGIKDSRAQTVLRTFVRFGAPPEILFDAKPHIGTDKLTGCVMNIRKHIESLGGEVHFESRLTRILQDKGSVVAAQYEDLAGIHEVKCTQLILAIGHSARDTFEQLYEDHFTLIPKPFSMGVRIEHPQKMINRSQFGDNPPPVLGAADYKLAIHLPDGRGVYTFCMCPGGTVVAAASEPDTVVTNGMSRYARDGQNANSALLVGISPEDFPDDHPLSGMYWQRLIEQRAFILGGRNGHAPAQLVGDFLRSIPSTKAGSILPSYLPGVTFCDLHELFPPLFTDALSAALPILGRKLHGFDHPDAVLTAPETRSSCPVRLPRSDALESLDVSGLYPCGEGAGYAGGITSAAVDGIRCAEAIIQQYSSAGTLVDSVC